MACGNNMHHNYVNVHDTTSVLNYLKHFDEIKTITNNKYAVVLYGSPASGKRIAKKIACKLICDHFEKSQISIKDLFDTFIDTEVDSIIYDIVDSNNISLKDKMLDAYKQIINVSDTDVNDVNIIKSAVKTNIKDIVDATGKIYFLHKKEADAISEFILSYSVVANKNIFFEISSANIEYIQITLDRLKYYGYIPILIYPYINDVEILYNRAIDRGIKEGRFFTKQMLNDKIIPLFEKYPQLKDIIKCYDTYGIFQYNSDIPYDTYRSYDRFEINDLEKFMIDMNINIKSKI